MKKYLILGGIIVLSGIAINYFLGGFEQLKPEHVEINDMTIFGKSYEGRYASDSLDNIITSLNNLIKSDTSGALIIVNYLQEDLEKYKSINWKIPGIEKNQAAKHQSR